MNANAFRHLYDYHFAENRKLWGYIMQLTPEQFTQPVNYSHGSVRDQIVHLMEVDEVWFSELQGIQPQKHSLLLSLTIGALFVSTGITLSKICASI